MHQLGHTRSAHAPDHLLQTPDTFVRAPLPGMVHANAIVHASPAGGARFVQYTVEFEANGLLAAASGQRFLYVIEGTVAQGHDTLSVGDFAYAPTGSSQPVTSPGPARAIVIEKAWQALDGVTEPVPFIGRESRVTASYMNEDPWLAVQSLIPDEPAFDFRVNTMTYQPGATLPAVEVHVMEHGLLMLEGGGIYRLGDRWYPVAAGDFIWMSAYCPQWFGALGKTPAKYLIYKDWSRRP